MGCFYIYCEKVFCKFSSENFNVFCVESLSHFSCSALSRYLKYNLVFDSPQKMIKCQIT